MISDVALSHATALRTAALGALSALSVESPDTELTAQLEMLEIERGLMLASWVPTPSVMKCAPAI